MKQITLPVVPISAEAFAPFGRLFGPVGERSFGRPNFDAWVMPFAAEGPSRLQYVRMRPREASVQIIERHLHVTETRQPISGPPCVLVVGVSSDQPPRPEDMVAFDMRGQGIMLHPGTWHSIDAYPRGEGASDFLFLSEEATVRELFDGTADPQRSQIFDFAAGGIRLTFD
jgi:ureidoglycolate hydrolase